MLPNLAGLSLHCKGCAPISGPLFPATECGICLQPMKTGFDDKDPRYWWLKEQLVAIEKSPDYKGPDDPMAENILNELAQLEIHRDRPLWALHACGHSYHTQCAIKLLPDAGGDGKCPLCRTLLDRVDLDDLPAEADRLRPVPTLANVKRARDQFQMAERLMQATPFDSDQYRTALDEMVRVQRDFMEIVQRYERLVGRLPPMTPIYPIERMRSEDDLVPPREPLPRPERSTDPARLETQPFVDPGPAPYEDFMSGGNTTPPPRAPLQPSDLPPPRSYLDRGPSREAALSNLDLTYSLNTPDGAEYRNMDYNTYLRRRELYGDVAAELPPPSGEAAGSAPQMTPQQVLMTERNMNIRTTTARLRQAQENLSRQVPDVYGGFQSIVQEYYALLSQGRTTSFVLRFNNMLPSEDAVTPEARDRREAVITILTLISELRDIAATSEVGADSTNLVDWAVYSAPAKYRWELMGHVTEWFEAFASMSL
jgi:hypothetical protein